VEILISSWENSKTDQLNDLIVNIVDIYLTVLNFLNKSPVQVAETQVNDKPFEFIGCEVINCKQSFVGVTFRMRNSVKELVTSKLPALERQSTLSVFFLHRLSVVESVLVHASCNIKVLKAPVSYLVELSRTEINQTFNSVVTD
jgi:hypothetical protein